MSLYAEFCNQEGPVTTENVSPVRDPETTASSESAADHTMTNAGKMIGNNYCKLSVCADLIHDDVLFSEK